MGTPCCKRKLNENEALFILESKNKSTKESPNDDIALEKAKKSRLSSFDFDKLAIQAIKIQAWVRGLMLRKKNKHIFKLSAKNVKDLISERMEPNNPIVKSIEQKLGPFDVSFDIRSDMEGLEWRKPVKDDNGTIYSGYWDPKINKRQGYGQQIASNGAKYEGFFKGGEFDGIGRLINFNGDYYIGTWEMGKASGNGTFVTADGNKYTGEWKENVHHGHGICESNK